MNLNDAISFNRRQIDFGQMRDDDIAFLVEYFQSGRGLLDDGKAGPITLTDLLRYKRESQPAPDPRSPFADWFYPMCAKRGERAGISNKFGASREGGKRRHAGVDIMRKRSKPGAVRHPEYTANWYVTSDPEDPVLAMGPGKVTIARWGIALNGERVLSVTIDHGSVGEYKHLGSFYLHCARLIVKPGEHVDGGQVIAITGHTATNINHQHDELFTGPTRAGNQIDPAPLLAQMRHRDMDPGTGEFNQEWLGGLLPPEG